LVVGWGTKVTENGSNDFSDFLHIVRHQKVKKSDTAGFSEKNPDSAKNAKMWSKWWFLAIFSNFFKFKFFYTVNLVSGDQYEASAKNRMSK